ncbi:MAG: M56 family metallopeptidase [Arachidicoccus sp.]|nr:M56 family metallopeptidase [Arachidicoccus sp.]
MIIYLIKSIVCSGILLGVYFFFLEKEKIHQFNRFYLLFAWIISWIIPLISCKIQILKIADIKEIILPNKNFKVQYSPSEKLINNTLHESSLNLSNITWIIYAIITLILLIRFIMNLYQIKELISSNIIQKNDKYSLVSVPHNNVSFSFFNYIFLAENDYVDDIINEEIFLHETVHSKEKHSIDILFIELIKVFLWINPFVFLYKKAIQINHEFIADDVVVRKNNVTGYQHLLLTKILQAPISKLVSSSSYSITKKRFIMMTKKTKQSKALLLKFLIIPITGALILGFSKNTVKEKNTNIHLPTFIIQDTGKKIIARKEVKKFAPPKVVKDKEVKKFAPPKIIKDTSINNQISYRIYYKIKPNTKPTDTIINGKRYVKIKVINELDSTDEQVEIVSKDTLAKYYPTLQ